MVVASALAAGEVLCVDRLDIGLHAHHQAKPRSPGHERVVDANALAAGDLPCGDRLVVGLNPPFGKESGLGGDFAEHAATQFRPRLIVLIVPPTVQVRCRRGMQHVRGLRLRITCLLWVRIRAAALRSPRRGCGCRTHC